MYSMDNDIDHILCDGYIHGETGILHTDIPAGKTVKP